ncbi:hypothetical protein Poli38472_000357 [Pythium oligandrum]|uniref:Uncharacterized protein n=1 Tax=Pythium oligandrum TaxID=41045 RepID=A0A8K1FEA2_PYTOL|nr:hypothetical protein Poli38472_000357 [Pythium oligandrum]|eukprot:TMW60315.1 hypothetical protein Poli38472_000357 [Pythium oligandrum]
MVAELQRILVATWLYISILLSLADAKILLQDSQNTNREDLVRASDPGGPRIDDTTGAVVIPRLKRSMAPVLQVMIFIIGAAILLLQLIAQAGSPNDSCMLPVHPWASSQPGCAYLRFNCTSEELRGSKNELTPVLAAYDPNILQVLEFTSCPELHVPPYIQKFGHLSRLCLISSNITEWGSDAALTATHHSRLTIVQVEDTLLPQGQIPPGLMGPTFPPNLRSIRLRSTNLATLPFTIAPIWPPGMALIYEAMNATRIPDVLFFMAFYYLSMGDNQLTEIPIKLFYTPLLMYLDLHGNPFTGFPEVPASMLEQYGPPGVSMLRVDVSGSGLEQLPT